MSGRKEHAVRNITFGYAGQLITTVMSFVLRTVFIRRLSDTLLGVNATYTNILTLLSMAELGIGTALTYSLYKPAADGDTEEIKSYMLFYRRAYRYIAVAIASAGLILTPFLPYIVKNPAGLTVKELTVYYLIFLFNTVSTYFVSYKYSICMAQQKNYIQTNINTITKIVSVLFQLIALLVTSDFLFYLLADAAVQLIQKIFVSRYLDSLYPFLKDRDIRPLPSEKTSVIWQKTRALVLHRVGDMLRLQTDTVIISSCIEVAVAGLVDNYVLVAGTVANFVNIIFNSVISGFGNLIASEDRDKQYDMFMVYRFLAVWIYGFAVTGFFILLSPLICILWGEKWLMPQAAVMLYLLDYYLKGERVVLSNFKTAAGVFEQDKYLSMLQGIVNLIISLALVKPMGLAGIYVGTVVSGLIANITKPVIIYRVCFSKNAAGYFAETLGYMAVPAVCTAVCYLISRKVMPVPALPGFIAMGVIITVVFNACFFLVHGRSPQFRYLCGMVTDRLKRRSGR